MTPPAPMLVHVTITSVVVTFWGAIIFGGWPFKAVIRNEVAAGLVLLVACYVVNYLLFRIFFDYGFIERLADEHRREQRDWSANLWCLLNLSVWYERWIEPN